ncbi:hypothetical protein ACG83_37005 [Frankia sp. R43]|nr:hypothetical protein ACG83_37005 [Frankia sp. R43]
MEEDREMKEGANTGASTAPDTGGAASVEAAERPLDTAATDSGVSATDIRRKFNDMTTGLAPHVVSATEKTRDVAERAAGAVREKVAQNPTVATATERTVEAKDKALSTVRDQLDQHPQAAAAVERTAVTSGKAARTVGEQARRRPRATGGVAFGVAVLLLLRRTVHRRGAARSARSGD